MKSFFKKIIVFLITLEARLILKKYKPKIVGITGSVGKTSTKDAIFTVLQTQFFVRKSQKSFNSEIGVPLTVLGCENGWNNPFIWINNLVKGLAIIVLPLYYPSWLVLEIGADRPNDIKNLVKWVKPDITVVTRFGETPVHVEFFRTKARLIEEKSYLVSAIKDGGTLIVNGDDEDALSFLKLTKSKSLTVSVGKEADVVASHYSIVYEKGDKDIEFPVGLSFKANFSGNSIPVNLKGVLGVQHVYPSLLAVAVGIAAGLNIISICETLSSEVLTPGRMRVLSGIKNTILIDDTYNSSPVAIAEALNTLSDIKTTKRKIAILGDMMDLGTYSKNEHLQAGKRAASTAHILITVGIRARDIGVGALEGGMAEQNIFQFDDAPASLKFIDDFILEGDAVLVKGSQFVRMEKVVEEIMAHPEDKENLLVRQDKEWQKR